MELGEIIRAKRQALGWSQKKLAETAGIEEAQVSKYERGVVTPLLDTLRDLADAFGIELSELVDDVPRKRKMPPEIREKWNKLHELLYDLMCLVYEDA